MSAIAYQLLADFDLDGIFETDLTPRAGGPNGAISISRGIGSDGRYKTSNLDFILDNEDGVLTIENALSALYGQIKPRVPITFIITFLGTDYRVWTGYIENIDQSWESGNIYTVRFACMDVTGFLAQYQPVYVTTSTSRDTDDALIAIMTAAGFDSSFYNFDDGIQNLQYHFVVGADAASAILDVIKSEMGGLLWVQADGKIRFENRHSRLGYGSVDRTWGDGTEILPKAVSYRMNTKDIISQAEVVETLFTEGDQTNTILRFSRGAETEDSILLAAGETYGDVNVNYGGLAKSVTSPEAATDYKGNSAIDGSGIDLTSLLSVSVTDEGGYALISIRNTSSSQSVYLTFFRLRGIPVALSGSRPQYISVKSVPDLIGNTGVQLDVPYGGDSGGQKGRDYSIEILRTFRYPYPLVQLSFDWADDDLTAEMLDVEIGDLVLYKDIDLGKHSAQLNDYWYVEAINHDGFSGANVPETTILLSPAYNYRNLDNITYDRFTRPNTGSGLGVSLSGHNWQNSTVFKILSNKARATSDSESITRINLNASDCVVEVDLLGI